MATTKKKPVAATAKKAPTKKTSTARKPAAKTAVKKTITTKKPAAKKTSTQKKTTAAPKKTTITRVTTTSSRVITPSQATTAAATAKPSSSQWQGVAALILALCALIFCWIPVLNVILAVLALIFGILALKTTRRGMGIASIIISIFTLIIALIFTLIIGAAFNFASKEVKRAANNINTINREVQEEVDSGEVGLNTTLGRITTDLIMNTANVQHSDIELISSNNMAGQETLSVETPDNEYFALMTPSDAIIIQSYIYENEVNTVFDPDSDALTSTVPPFISRVVRNVATVFEEYAGFTFIDPATAIMATSLNNIDQADASYIVRADGYSQYTVNSVDKTKTLFIIFDSNNQMVAAGYSNYETWN